MLSYVTNPTLGLKSNSSNHHCHKLAHNSELQDIPMTRMFTSRQVEVIMLKFTLPSTSKKNACHYQ